MLLKVDCEPKLMACVTLTFDDGTTKDVDIQKGMYATIQYMHHAVSKAVTGIVTNVYLAPKAMKVVEPNDIPNHLGYICDPNYVNSGFLDARDPYHRSYPPRKPKPLPCPGKHDNDFRNYIEVLDKATGKSVRIDVYSIVDVFTIYQESREVRTPDDYTRIMFIRDNNGLFEYSLNGNDWSTVSADFDTEKIDSIERIVSGNSASISEVKGAMDEYDTKMAEYDEKVTAQDAKITEYADSISAQNDKIGSIDLLTTANGASIDELRTTIDELTAKVAALEAEKQAPSE